MSAIRCFLPDRKILLLAEVIKFWNPENTCNYSMYVNFKRVFLKMDIFWNFEIYLLLTYDVSPSISSPTLFEVFYFNGFNLNSNSCTANDRNRRIQISRQWRLRKCNPYFIRPILRYKATMGSSSFKGAGGGSEVDFNFLMISDRGGCQLPGSFYRMKNYCS